MPKANNNGQVKNPFIDVTMPSMQAYDSLPAPLRKVLGNAPYAYASEDTLNNWIDWCGRYPELLARGSLANLLADALQTAYDKERLSNVPLSIAMAPYKKIGY